MQIIGDVKGYDVVLVDDMVDTAGSITMAAKIIKDMGANSVRAIASHCILSGPAIQRIEDSALEEIVFTDTIPFHKECSKVKRLSIAKLIAHTIKSLEENESISSLYLIK
jgi:ribose-phosphate pyrophosphokinase